MGTYFNPDNGSFRNTVKSRIYVDKTGLLELLNEVLGTSENCIALSHARRFGKSQDAGALKDYTDKIVLAGISYDKKTKKHECVIEEILL